jgi:hypothetical protein
MPAAKRLLPALILLLSLSCRAQPGVEAPSGLFAPLDVSQSIPISIVDLTAESDVAGPNDAELARWALQDWSRALDGALRFHVVETEDAALVRVRFVPPGGGQYGEMVALDVDGRRGAAVFVRPDTRALGPVIAKRAESDPLFRETIVYLTCLHELGHALGLAHTDQYADIMYAFGFGGDIEEYFMRYRRRIAARADIAEQSGLSPADEIRARQLYGIGVTL